MLHIHVSVNYCLDPSNQLLRPYSETSLLPKAYGATVLRNTATDAGTTWTTI